MNKLFLIRRSAKSYTGLTLSFTLLLSACTAQLPGIALDWGETNQQGITVTMVPSALPGVPTPMLPTSTAIAPTTTPIPSATESPTTTVAISLPRDEKGRVIGGAMPVINYSPSMIVGKACPRVTEWDFDLVKLPAPFQNYGISKSPCVVQNAVDDLVRTLWFNPAFQNPETMRAVDAVYDSDPMNVLGVEKTLRNSLIRFYHEGKQNYNICDKPVYRLLVVDAKAPLIANNDGRVSGRAIQIMMLRATRDEQPFTCQFVSYGDGSVNGKFELTEAMLRGKEQAQATVYKLLWNAQTRRWVVYFSDVIPIDNYPTLVQQLFGRLSTKP